MALPPEMRAGQIRTDLAGIDELPNSAAIKAALRPETLKAVAEARTAAWLPIELDIELNEAVHQVLGEEPLRTWSRKAMVKSFEGPLLKPMVGAAAKLFGLNPLSWLKWLPRLWPAMVRNAGVLEVVESSATGCTLAYRDPPPIVRDSQAFLVGLSGACEGTMDLCQHDGRVEHRVDQAKNVVFFDARWKAKA